MINLESAAAFWVLGLIPTADLQRAAVDALELGLDSPSLRILAGELHHDCWFPMVPGKSSIPAYVRFEKTKDSLLSFVLAVAPVAILCQVG